MMRKSLAILVLALTISTSPLYAETVTFEKAASGSAPGDFDFWRTGEGGPGRWAVVEDETAQAGLVLEQTSTEPTDYRFPLAIYKPFSGDNVEVQTHFKPVAGRVDRAGGIAVRLMTPGDYYVVRANALENNVRFYRVIKDKREQLAGFNTKVTTNEWHTLGLRAEGDRFTISFDGKQLFTATDETFKEPGKVALWTKADSVTRFDRLEIRQLP
jgi:hypothetical protein